MATRPTTHALMTWNTQGFGDSTEKLNRLKYLLDNYKIDVAFIQEGGSTMRNFGDLSVTYLIPSGYQVGSRNDRCNCYVLAKRSDDPSEVLIVNANGSLPLAGGEAARSSAALAIDRTLFISWHATANGATDSTAALINALQKNPEYSNNYDTVIIGGDLNTDPDAMLASIQHNCGMDRSSRTQWSLRDTSLKFDSVELLRSNDPTHKAGGELDYFIVLNKKPAVNFGGQYPFVVRVPESDHDPVVLPCSINYGDWLKSWCNIL